jgi:hypothetical protein
MMKRLKLRILAISAMCALSLVLMGGGNDCPKPCIAAGTACAQQCGGALTGECVAETGSGLKCEPGGAPIGGAGGDGGGTGD